MAQVGDVLLTPEAGWTRYNDNDNLIFYSGFTSTSASGCYDGTYSYTTPNGAAPNSKIVFCFKGTSFRIIGYGDSTRADSVDVYIDNVMYNFSCKVGNDKNILLYECTNLSDNIHKVILTNFVGNVGTARSAFVMTCLDVNENGYLIPELSRNYEFPVKIGDEKDVENYSKSLIGGEEQLLIAREGKLYLTDGLGGYKPIGGGGSNNGATNEVTLFEGSIEDAVRNIALIDDINNYNAIFAEFTHKPKDAVSLIPKMTSNTTPAPYVASSSECTHEAYGAFDSVVGSWANTWYSKGIPCWLQIDTGNSDTVVSSFSIVNGASASGYANYPPKAFTFEYSEDGINFHVGKQVTGLRMLGASEAEIFELDSPVKGRFFKLNFTEGYSTEIIVGEFKLHGAIIDSKNISNVSKQCITNNENGQLYVRDNMLDVLELNEKKLTKIFAI